MTAQNPALYLQGANHPAEDFRHLISKTFGGRDGVVQGDGLAVTEKSGTPDMSVDVSEGTVLVAGDEATYQGLYLCHNRGNTNLAISASDPTNPRWDLIVAQVEDSDYSGATDAWKLAVVTGTAAASPAFPTVPDNAFVLAVVAVDAAASSIVNADITDIRDASATDSSPGPGTTTITNYGRAASLGGLIVCTSSTRPQSPYEGMQIWETDTDFKLVYDGSAWKLTAPVLIDHGDLNTSFSGSTSWQTLVDKTDTYTAPCAGRLVVTITGRIGFNASAGQFFAGVGANSGADPTGVALSEGYAPAAKWTQVSASYVETANAGATFGFTVAAKDDIGSGTTHYDIKYVAYFYPDNLVGGL